jgi:hypothetical protein
MFGTAGGRNLTATYAGDANYTGGTSGPAAHQVNPAATTTTITSDTPEPSTAGQAVTIAFGVAAVAPGAGTPTGTVTVSDGTLTCQGTLAGAVGSCQITFTVAGPKSLTATFSGSADFTGSASAVRAHTVQAGAGTSITISAGDGQTANVGGAVGAAPSVRVTDSFANPVPGETVTFTVTGGGGTVTGETPATGADGVATVTSWVIRDTAAMSTAGTFSNTVDATASAGTVTFNATAVYSYSTHVQPIWNTSCVSCHTVLGPSLVAPSHGNLVDVDAPCSLSGGKRVATGGGLTAEAASILMAKMDNTAVAECPGQMPTGGVLPAATRDIVRAWIRNGAPNN